MIVFFFLHAVSRILKIGRGKAFTVALLYPYTTTGLTKDNINFLFYFVQNLWHKSWKWSASPANKLWSVMSRARCQIALGTTRIRCCSAPLLSWRAPGSSPTITMATTKEGNPSSASSRNSERNNRAIDTTRTLSLF